MKLNIVFFGDSICFGQGISIHKGWVPRISASLEKLAFEEKFELFVVNASVNGNTTRQALERMAYEVQSHSFNLVLVQFGMNDCNYWLSDKGLPRVSKLAFEGNLHEIITRAEKFGAKKVILNTNHPTTRNKIFPHTNISYQNSNEEYNDIIRKVGLERKNVILNDIDLKIRKDLSNNNKEIKDILLEDQLHLSLLGHEFYFKNTEPLIKKIVIENY